MLYHLKTNSSTLSVQTTVGSVTVVTLCVVQSQHLFSFGSWQSLVSWQASVSLLSNVSWRSNQTYQTTMALQRFK